MNAQRLILAVAVTLGLGYGWVRGAFADLLGAPEALVQAAEPSDAVATFAAGCFWSAEAAFEKVDGVRSVIAGFTGGREPNPTYAQVAAGATGHAEAIDVRYDPAQVSYDELLDRFWRTVDPFTAHRQFCDIGDSYRPAIFVRTEAERAAAEASRADMDKRFGRRVAVAIDTAGAFYAAEPAHQDYARRHPLQYRYYQWACGRDARLQAIWGRVTP